MWWIGFLGCATSTQVAELEQELAATKAALTEMETRLTALETPVPDEARRAALREKLKQRREERREERRLPAWQGGPELVEFVDRPDLTPRQAAADLEYAGTLGRALLHRGPDGEYDGYRLSAIRKGSMGDRLGVLNGDILHEVDGVPVQSMEDAMTAYARVIDPTVKVTTLTVLRRGAPIELQVPLDEVPPPYEPAAEAPAEPVP
jgi:hypothetical protein